MKILFICAGGMSTGLIVQKMEKWAKATGADLTVYATGVGGHLSRWKDYDCILMGPQVRFKLETVKKEVGIPVGVIEPLVYGLQQTDKMIEQAYQLTGQPMPK